MRRKQVWRYWCDFCNKGGNSGGHMKHHEERCTLNPNRTCGMCKAGNEQQMSMGDMLDLLPDPSPFVRTMSLDDGSFGWNYHDDSLFEEVTKSLVKLRAVTGNCPACILAAMRQKKIPIRKETFDFKKECDSWWAEFNNARADYY